MTGIDRSFYQMAREIQSLGEKELYHRMRRSFEAVPAETQKSCADFFNQFLYWGRLDPANGIFEEIEWKQQALTGTWRILSGYMSAWRLSLKKDALRHFEQLVLL